MALEPLPRVPGSLLSLGSALSVSAVGDGGSSETIAADLIFRVRLARFGGRGSISSSCHTAQSPYIMNHKTKNSPLAQFGGSGRATAGVASWLGVQAAQT